MKIGTCELCEARGVWVNGLECGQGRLKQACAECFDKKLPAKPIRSGGRSDPTVRTSIEYHGEYRGDE